MDVLEDERERILAQVLLARLADGAGRRVGPERLVVGAAVVVAREAEPAWRPQDQQRGRERERCGPPRRLRPEPAVRSLTEEQRRVEGGEIRAVLVVVALERCPGRVYDEPAQHDEREQRLRPPRVAPHRPAETP